MFFKKFIVIPIALIFFLSACSVNSADSHMNLYTASAEVQTEVSKTPQIPTATAESMVITEPDTTEAEATTSHRLISIWDGEIDDSFEEGLGTLEYPYVIASAAQLAYFANYVNSGQAFEGEHYILSCDVSLVERPWTPIGTHEHPFSGFFWGCSSTVSDIDVGEGHRYMMIIYMNIWDYLVMLKTLILTVFAYSVHIYSQNSIIVAMMGIIIHLMFYTWEQLPDT